MNTDHMLARSVAESITITTPGRVTLYRLRRRKAAPIVVIVAWLPVLLAIALAVITR